MIQLPWTKAGRRRGRCGLGDWCLRPYSYSLLRSVTVSVRPFACAQGHLTQLPGVFGPRLRPGVTVVATPASPHPVRASLELSTTEEKPQSRDQLPGLALSRTRL